MLVYGIFFSLPNLPIASAGASVPRNYHSISLLLPDARIFNGGSGLCGVGCACASSSPYPHQSPRPFAIRTTSSIHPCTWRPLPRRLRVRILSRDRSQNLNHCCTSLWLQHPDGCATSNGGCHVGCMPGCSAASRALSCPSSCTPCVQAASLQSDVLAHPTAAVASACPCNA